jgi:hypothetical protein
MRRWFLSYNSQDLGLIASLEAGLRRKDPDARIFFAPKNLRAGGLWLPELAREIAEATAFVLLVGEKGIGPWQAMEYYEALDRRVKEHDFPVVLVLLDAQPAPGLPFLRQLHWVITNDPASEKSLVQVMDATAGGGAPPPTELWRHTAPYRGLQAMTESDADFFSGRVRETAEVIGALAEAPDKLTILLGNSGVGKSSLAQAGVIAALMRQAWPETAETPGPWPPAFTASRHWCFLKLRLGSERLRALVEPFLWTWQFDAVDPRRAELQSSWAGRLLDEKVRLRDLFDATQARYRDELHQPEPPAFLIYIDEGEELYARSRERERRRFSEILAQDLSDPRLHAMISMRADYFGDLQKDEPLYAVHRQVNVPPLREAQLRDVVTRPAALLSARFEPEGLAADIARRTAEESAKDAGALPLLSYLLDDMWTGMVKRGDGTLRLPGGWPRSPPRWSPASTRSLSLIQIPRTNSDASLPCGSPLCARARSRPGAAQRAPSSRTRNGGWSANSPITRTACSSRQRPKSATPMPKSRMRQSSGAGTSWANGLPPSASSWPGEPVSKPLAARGRQHPTVRRARPC